MSDSDYVNASDALARVIGNAKGLSSGYHNETDHLSIDQQLKVVEIQALLAIAQELNQIHHNGISPDYNRGD